MKTLISIIAVIGALGACSTVPQRNASLEQARLAVSQAQNDPKIVQNAPVDLKRAQDTLRAAEFIWRDSPRDDRIDHLSYLAIQRSAIARENAGIKHAELAVEQTNRDRERLLLQARTREAEEARRQIAASRSEAERARLDAQSARYQALAQEQAQQQTQQQTERLQQQLNELQARETERGFKIMLSGVLFESGQASLKPGATRRLEQLAEVLRENPDRIALVEGFTDSVGDESFNEQLSEQRAQAVREKLLGLGVDPARIVTQGYGEAYPVASNQTASGRQQNRRVEIVVSTETAGIPPRGLVGRAGGEMRGHGGMPGIEQERSIQQLQDSQQRMPQDHPGQRSSPPQDTPPGQSLQPSLQAP